MPDFPESVGIWDRLDRRTRVGLFPNAGTGAEDAMQQSGHEFLVHRRSKLDIFGFWKRSEELRCKYGVTMREHDFTGWNNAIQAAKENAVRRGG